MRAHAGALCSGRAAEAGRPRWRGDVPTAAPEAKGKGVGEEERSAGKFTTRSNQAEVDRKVEIDVRGRSSGGQQWRSTGTGADSAEVRHR